MFFIWAYGFCFILPLLQPQILHNIFRIKPMQNLILLIFVENYVNMIQNRESVVVQNAVQQNETVQRVQ